MSSYKKLLGRDIDIEGGGGNLSNDTLLEKEELDIEYSDDGTYKLTPITIDEGRSRASKIRNAVSWKTAHIALFLLNILVLTTLIIQTNRSNHGPNLIACMLPFPSRTTSISRLTEPQPPPERP
jgi:hypothetical protein